MTRSEKLEAVIRELRRLPEDDHIINSLYDELACGEESQAQINEYESRWLDGQRL